MSISVVLILLQVFIVAIFLYFILRNKIDFLLLFFTSFILYHWQIIAGTIWVPPYEFAASIQSVFVVGIVATVLIVVTLINDRVSFNVPMVEFNHRKDRDQKNVSLVLIVISYAATGYAIYSAGDAVFSGNKADFTRSMGLKYDFLYYFPAGMAFLYGVATKNRSIVFLSFLPLLFYLLVGYRAIIVTALVGAAVVNLYGQPILTFRMAKVILYAIVGYIFFVLYKFSYIAFKTNSFDWFATMIEKDARFDSVWEILLWGMFSAEFGQVASNLSMSSAIDMSEHYQFSSAFLGSIPGLNSILNFNEDMTRFSRAIREHANPGFSYGLGSSFWGEMYQAGSYVGVFMASTIVIGCIAVFNLSFRRNKEKYTLLLLLFSFLAFYIHRNDFTLVVGYMKNHIILLVFSYLVLLLLKGKVKIRNYAR